jgi:PAS domain S-box-containing protein
MDVDNSTVTLCKAIVEATSDAVIFADRGGSIRLWNRGAELLFGYTAAEATGQRLDLIIPERLRRAHWDAYDRALQTGAMKHTDRVLTTRSMHKDGRKLYVDLGFGLVKDAGGAVMGAFATGRDCTDRYIADAALKARVRELEAKLSPAAPAGEPASR